jgi:hypothetical protein
LQHIDFSLPRKHKPARFTAIERAPLTTLATANGRMHRSRSPQPAWAPFAAYLLQIFRNRITID